MSENKLNVYQRLLEVRKSVSYLKKDADNQSFKYVSSSQTLAAVREEMNNQGLMLIPSVEGFDVRDHETSNKAHWYFTILDMTFTWINVDNPEDKVTSKWTGHGLDQGEKGVGKALTYAEKYFMLKFFNIPTDRDDPDAFEEKHSGKKNGKTGTTTKTTGTKTTTKKPEPTGNAQEVVVKINANLLILARQELPKDAKDAEILVKVDALLMQFTGAKNTEELSAQEYRGLCIKHGNIKKRLANNEAVNQKFKEVVSKEVKDLQNDLPF